MIHTIRDIKRCWILWESITGVQTEVKYSLKEWGVLRKSIVEKAGLPKSSLKLKNMPGISLDMNDNLTEALSWEGVDGAVFLGMRVCLHEPEALDQLAPSRRASLTTGDIAFFSKYRKLVLVERKTWPDICAGLMEMGKTKTQSPRNINDQMTRLLNEADLAFIVRERHPKMRLKDGFMFSVHKSKPPWHNKPISYVDGWLLPWQLAGITLIESDGVEDTVRKIQWLYDFLQKDNHTVVYKAPRQITVAPGTTKGVNLLLGIEGFGDGIARKAMETFKTARAFFNATPNQRAFHALGIGQKLALRVDEYLDEEYKASERLEI